jgi:hypothetical protein
VFKVAFDRWVNEGRKDELPLFIRESLDELKAISRANDCTESGVGTRSSRMAMVRLTPDEPSRDRCDRGRRESAIAVGLPLAFAAPSTDGAGYVDSTARCAAPSTVVLFGSTDSSRVAICKAADGKFEYRECESATAPS